MLQLSEELAQQIRAHGVEAYPRECCGALLGTDSPRGREVRALFRLTNRRKDSPQNRYLVSPEDFRSAEDAAVSRGLELIGWYHSHPDHPAIPSAYDQEHAWPWYSYIIVSVAAGEPREMNAWRLADDRSGFFLEEVEIRQSAPAVALRTVVE